MGYTAQGEKSTRIPDGAVVPVKLIEVNVDHKEGVSKRTGEPYSFDRLKWKFQVTEGPHEGKYVFADSGADLVEGSRFWNFVGVLRGREVQYGEPVDVDDVIGLTADALVKHETYRKQGAAEDSVVVKTEELYAATADPFSDSAGVDPWADISSETAAATAQAAGGSPFDGLDEPPF